MVVGNHVTCLLATGCGCCLSVSADGVKGKTWGPSTCHQRERSQIPMLRSTPRPGGICSVSAPNLVRPRLTLSRAAHDLGKSTNPPESTKSPGDRGDNTHISPIQQLVNKVTALTFSEFKPFKNPYRNNSYPSNEASVLARNRLSRSIGNISESHYDTVFSTSNFIIARGVSNNNSVNYDRSYSDTEKLLKK